MTAERWNYILSAIRLINDTPFGRRFITQVLLDIKERRSAASNHFQAITCERSFSSNHPSPQMIFFLQGCWIWSSFKFQSRALSERALSDTNGKRMIAVAPSNNATFMLPSFMWHLQQKNRRQGLRSLRKQKPTNNYLFLGLIFVILFYMFRYVLIKPNRARDISTHSMVTRDSNAPSIETQTRTTTFWSSEFEIQDTCIAIHDLCSKFELRMRRFSSSTDRPPCSGIAVFNGTFTVWPVCAIEKDQSCPAFELKAKYTQFRAWNAVIPGQCPTYNPYIQSGPYNRNYKCVPYCVSLFG